jgi:phospholipase A1
MKKSNKFLVLMLLCTGSAQAADPGAFAQCAKTFPDQAEARLKCFDNALSDSHAAPVQKIADEAEAPATAPVAGPLRRTETGSRDKRSYLTRVWNLNNRTHHDSNMLDRLQPHKQSYLIVRETSRLNRQPTSPSPGRTVLTPYDLDALEAKFQLSFKTDIGALENFNLWGLKTLRVWGAYTQQSQWQVFNARNSSPFRETNYEPELIAAFATGNDSGWKLLNLGIVHQSNGKSKPESRSWNRVYAQGGWEWDNVSLQAKGWWRIPENAAADDNPDIVHYLGRAELVARWEPEDKSQSVSMLLRNNLNLNQNIGFMQFDWSVPVALGHAARLHAQFGTGYGESMIDYNHRQTTMGLGISFREW